MKKKFMDESFLTPEQVAQKLQLSIMTVYNLIKGQELPAIRIGKSYRIPESGLDQLWSKAFVPAVVLVFVERLSASLLADRIVDVVLFGSCARGTQDDDSDIDILVVHKDMGQEQLDQLIKIKDESSSALGYRDEMNVVKKTLLQWKTMEQEKSGLYKSVSSEGVSLWKNPPPYLSGIVRKRQ